jgi:hypothetical protein
LYTYLAISDVLVVLPAAESATSHRGAVQSMHALLHVKSSRQRGTPC